MSDTMQRHVFIGIDGEGLKAPRELQCLRQVSGPHLTSSHLSSQQGRVELFSTKRTLALLDLPLGQALSETLNATSMSQLSRSYTSIINRSKDIFFYIFLYLS